MSLFKRFILSTIILFPLSVLAHGYWIEVEGSHKVKEPVTIKLIFGEYETGERLSGTYLDRMKEIKVFVIIPGGGKQEVQMKQLNNFWEGTFTPEAEGTYEITAINDEREVQDWKAHNLGIVRPIQYLKTIYQAGTAGTAQHHSSFLDIETTKISSGKYQLKLFKRDSVFTEMKITVTHPDGWMIKTLFTDKEGNASFTTTEPAFVFDRSGVG